MIVHVRFAPEADKIAESPGCPLSAKSGLMRCSKKGSLFHHLVGDLLQMRRNVETERLASLEVDHQPELDRSLHGKLTWICVSQTN
jgi:hypothetical protein